ncbi:MAG: hypothetical protein B7Z72_01515 [Gemmatimonadetes bacterium 21-71-4]|nr:MAG: hypothetical protein B7Z72_01515 [Gemmatimonadetes bacterium 21-71-4]
MSPTTVALKLGLPGSVRSVRELNAALEAGLPARALERVATELAVIGVARSHVLALVGRTRTLQRKLAGHLRLSADESDRLARLARVVVRAEEVLGSSDRAGHWLTRPNRGLGGEPLDFLRTDAGTVAVEQELGRIEHGIFG